MNALFSPNSGSIKNPALPVGKRGLLMHLNHCLFALKNSECIDYYEQFLPNQKFNISKMLGKSRGLVKDDRGNRRQVLPGKKSGRK
jgi:hypothetical protein